MKTYNQYQIRKPKQRCKFCKMLYWKKHKCQTQQRKKDSSDCSNENYLETRNLSEEENKAEQMSDIADIHSAEILKLKNDYAKLFHEMAHYKNKSFELMCELKDLQGAYDIAIKEINRLRSKLK